MGGRNLCPSTGTVLTLPVTLVPNVALRKSIEVWAEKHARWMLVSQVLFSSLYREHSRAHL